MSNKRNHNKPNRGNKHVPQDDLKKVQIDDEPAEHVVATDDTQRGSTGKFSRASGASADTNVMDDMLDDDEEDAPTPEDVPKDKEPEGTVEIKHDWSFDIDKDVPDNGFRLYMPSRSTNGTFDGYESALKVHLQPTNEKDIDWISDVHGGWKYNTTKELLVKALQHGKWGQEISTENEPITMNQGVLSDMSGKEISGERAMWRALSHTGSGNVIQVPLFHSGFWVTLSPPGDDEITDLHRSITTDKIKLGRYTNGAMFSNTATITNQRFFEFINKHIESSTIRFEDGTGGEVGDYILLNDLPILIWGMACAMHPDGHNYKRACSSTPDKCKTVHEGLLDLSKLMWMDDVPMNQWQRNMMSRRKSRSNPVANVKRYQSELRVGREKSYKIDHGFGRSTTFVLKSPTINSSIEHGNLWMDDIADGMKEALGKDPTLEARNKFIKDNALASYLRQYAHWVTKVDLGSNGYAEKITDIHAILGTFTNNDKLRATFLEKVVEYIDRSTIALIGIPSYHCPICGGEQHSGDSGEVKDIILPLDVHRTFFTMLGIRVERIRERAA